MSNISGIIGGIRTIMWQDTGLNGDAQRIEQLGWMLFLKIFSDKDLEMELMNSKYKSPIPEKFHWVKEKGNWAGDDEGMTGDALASSSSETKNIRHTGKIFGEVWIASELLRKNDSQKFNQ